MKAEATVVLIIVGAVIMRSVAMALVAQRVADGIVKEAGSRAPEVRAAAEKAGRTFAQSLGFAGVARLALSQH